MKRCIEDLLDEEGWPSQLLLALIGLGVVIFALAAACLQRLITGEWPEV